MDTTGEREAAAARDTAAAEALRRAVQHQSAGRFEEAGNLLDRLIAEHPGNARLIHYKGFNLCRTGRPDEGRAMIEEALRSAPQDPLQLTDYGALLAETGDLEAATEQFRIAVETAPNYSVARGNLGAALVLDRKFAEAIPHLERAIELDPDLLDAHTNLAIAYFQSNRFDKATDVLFKALAIDPQSVNAHIQLSQTLYRRERYEAAEHHARRALELAPQAAEAALHLGNALASAGRMDEAVRTLLAIAGRPPVGLPALARLFHIRKTVAGAPELAILEGYFERLGELPEESQATLHYSAGKAYDDLGEYGRAFGHLVRGNAINKRLYPFDAAAHEQRIERLCAVVTPGLLQRCAGGGVHDLAPVFVCGMPRSGTTLMDQMFSRHPAVQAGGELAAVPRAMQANVRLREALEDKLPADALETDDFSRLGESYVAAVRGEGFRTVFVSDKLPANYLYIGLLALALPRARFLVMRRHPLDCLFSNYLQHFGQNQPFSSDFGNLALVYRGFDRMARHWGRLLPDRVREVSYEAVTAAPEAQMRAVLEFVGLDWAPEVLDHAGSLRQVNTASMAQVREPIYQSSVARWRRYGPLLQELAEELRDFLTVEELKACGVGAGD